MSQGTFQAQKLESGEVGFLNPQLNRNLAHELKTQPQSSRALSSQHLDLLSSEQPIPLRIMQEMVSELDELHEREGGVVK
jgi:hypothetical protein